VTKKIKLIFISVCLLSNSLLYPKVQKEREYNKKYNLSETLWQIKLSTTEVSEINKKIETEPVVRGIHLTSWVAGDDKLRKKMIENISNSVINTVVVAVKEKNGEVYIPGIDNTIKYKTYKPAILNPKKMIADFNKLKLYKVARIVCFHDDILPKHNPELAVRRPDGSVWKTRNGDMWVDPYNKKVWDYIMSIAEKAAEYGFDEIQFDYVRYPTEGDTSLCRYSAVHNRENAEKNLVNFFKYARSRLSKYNVKISADVFGLTTSSDMGIGQNLRMISESVDYVYPMMYPSHYYSGEYNLADPDSEPYKVLNRGLKQAMNMTGFNYYKIRPYLQDFTLKKRYTSFDVRAQIIAVKNNYLKSWILWNPKCIYSWDTLTPQMFCAFVEPEKCYKK
jgi:hypothetical protein